MLGSGMELGVGDLGVVCSGASTALECSDGGGVGTGVCGMRMVSGGGWFARTSSVTSDVSTRHELALDTMDPSAALMMTV